MIYWSFKSCFSFSLPRQAASSLLLTFTSLTSQLSIPRGLTSTRFALTFPPVNSQAARWLAVQLTLNWTERHRWKVGGRTGTDQRKTIQRLTNKEVSHSEESVGNHSMEQNEWSCNWISLTQYAERTFKCLFKDRGRERGSSTVKYVKPTNTHTAWAMTVVSLCRH